MYSKKKAFICVCTAVAIMLLGCSKAKEQGNSTDVNGDGLPIVENHEELKIWAPMHGNHSAAGITSIADTVSAKELERVTNVKINWDCASSTDENTLFNLLIASDELPDVIMTQSTNAAKLIDAGIIVPINEYIDKYGKNFSRIMDKVEYYKSDAADADGKIWGMYSYYPDVNLTGIWTFPLIRQDWLDKLNMQMPSNQDEWYSVLKAFKENDLNGNGQKDEIPMTLRQLWQVNYLAFWPLGITNDFYVNDSKIEYGFTNERFKDGLAFAHKLYEEGLIDQEFLVQDQKQMERKILSDKVGATIGGSYNYINEYKEQLKNTLPNYNMVIANDLKCSDGQRYSFDGDVNKIFSSYAFFVTKSCKNPELAVRWIDYLFSEDGGNIVQYGKEGETFDMVDNKPIFRKDLLIDPNTNTFNTVNRSKYTFGGDGSYGYGFPHYVETPTQSGGKWFPEDITIVFGSDENFLNTYNARNSLNISKKIPGAPSMVYTEAEQSELSQIMTDIKKYTNEVVSQIIVGTMSVDEYDNAADKVKGMNIERAVEIHQSAYDKLLQKRQNKLSE